MNQNYGDINDTDGLNKPDGSVTKDYTGPKLSPTDMGVVAKARLMNSKLRSQAIEDRLNMAASANHRSRELSPYNPQPGKPAQGETSDEHLEHAQAGDITGVSDDSPNVPTWVVLGTGRVISGVDFIVQSKGLSPEEVRGAYCLPEFSQGNQLPQF